MDTEETAAALSAAIGAISGAVSSGESSYRTAQAYGPVGEPNVFVYSFDQLLRSFTPKAVAEVTACGVAAFADTCNAGNRRASYTDCPIGTSGLRYSGTIDLQYSDAACNLNINDSLNRSLNYTRNTVLGGRIEVSSDSHTDYRGNVIGGGAKITRTGATSYSLEHRGIRRQRISATGTTTVDISLRTTTDFNFSGYGSGNILVGGGVMEIIHNNAEYVAQIQASDLSFSPATCCYPRSGSISINYSGSRSGEATARFGPGCGNLTLTSAGTDTTLELDGCE